MKDRQTLQVETPVSQDDPKKVTVEEIPLPPEEMWKDLDNSGAKAASPATTPEEPAKRERRAAMRLNFLRATEAKVPLEFPFEWEGKNVDTIVLKRLTVGEVGDLIDTLPDNFDNYDIYAAMCGLPASVLRGLIDVDGQKVAEVGYDFLPRLFQTATESTNASGSS